MCIRDSLIKAAAAQPEQPVVACETVGTDTRFVRIIIHGTSESWKCSTDFAEFPVGTLGKATLKGAAPQRLSQICSDATEASGGMSLTCDVFVDATGCSCKLHVFTAHRRRLT